MAALNERQVYVIYSPSDRSAVAEFVSSLREHGFDVALAEDIVGEGGYWTSLLEGAIRGSSVVVIFVSKAALAGDGAFEAETRFALACASSQPEKVMLPVVVDGSLLPDTLAHLQSRITWTPDGLLEAIGKSRNVPEWPREISSSELKVVFDPDLEPTQVAGVLTALANYFRACGGIGLAAEFESETVTVLEGADV